MKLAVTLVLTLAACGSKVAASCTGPDCEAPPQRAPHPQSRPDSELQGKLGTSCTGGAECTPSMCDGAYPLLPPQVWCRADSDCPASDGAATRCTSYVLNYVHYDHICVHPGRCVRPEEVVPR